MIDKEFLERLFGLQDNVAIVTGAARGNGRAMSEALLGAGASLLLVDVLGEIEQVATELQKKGTEVCALRIDATQEDAPEIICRSAKEAFGRIDILVNNAGIAVGHDALTYPDDAWERTYQVNLKAPFRLSRAVAGAMRDRGGSIINITSLNAEMAFPNNPAYVAFKGGLKQLTKALALDLAPYGIRVNSIGPGYMRTEMTKKSYSDPVLHEDRRRRTALGRWGEPSDLAGAVIYLASGASAYVTGADLYVDGGWLIKGL
jgi:NAD(P)-dependent dehydrogenase (short-subunit alcohol dehydrogenase family)